jgi:23S rRNA (pseudouridine1915-N3)-methyltransferase
MVGKPKASWIDAGVAEYQKRLSSTLQFDTVWVADDTQLLQQIAKEEHILCLDPQGKHYSSEGLAAFLAKQFELAGSRITLVIGGAEGLPPAMRQGGYPLISLSTLTFTHPMCRLILAEQLYRCTEIWRGSPYHK